MSNYTLLIACSVAGCSLAGVLREHDRLAKELEYAHIKINAKTGLLRMLPAA